MMTYREPIRTQILARLLGWLLLCLFGPTAAGFAQAIAPDQISRGAIATIAGIQGNFADLAGTIPAVLATQTPIGTPTFILPDGLGNFYFTDNSGSGVVWFLYEGGYAPPVLSVPYPNLTFTAGYAYAIVNANGQPCGGGACGDGGLATDAQLKSPSGLAILPTTSDLYIADAGDNAIRVVNSATAMISTIAGDPMHTIAGYGGDNGQASLSLLSGPSSVAFDKAGDLYVSDVNNAIIRKVDTNQIITTVAGTVPSGGTPVVCTVAPCGDGGVATSAQLAHVDNIFIDGNGNIFATDSGAAAIRRIDARTQVIATVAGTLLAGQPFPDTCTPGATPPTCGDEGLATSALLNLPTASYLDPLGNLYIVDQGDNAVRVVDTSATIHTVVGQLSATGGYTADGSAAKDAMLHSPFAIAFDTASALYVTDRGNNIIRKVTPAAALPSQTLTFATLPTPTYGDSPIDLSGYVTSTSTSTGSPTGLSASFSVTSGPGTVSGTLLTITGAGTIVVKASQAGGAAYAPATPVTANIVVAQAKLTVAATQTAALKAGSPIPATFAYTIAGFVNADTQQSAVTGAPAFQVIDITGTVLPVGSVPAPGSYTIKISLGGLSATNYQFSSFTDGTLLDTLDQPQTVSLSAYTPPTVYGGASSTFTFSVSSSVVPMLPVTVTPTGPVRLQQLSATMWSATVGGAGVVTLTAIQAGNLTYAPASAMTQFVVSPAVLNIPVNNAMRQFGAVDPAFMYGTPTGFVGADNSSVLSGMPSYATTATQTSDPGTYPLTATKGNLSAQNYTFNFVAATLTITQATQQITNLVVPTTALKLLVDYPLQAMASSGLPIVYSATGAVQIDSGVMFRPTSAGPATVTATQAGNADYAAASATISFNVPPTPVYVTAVQPVSVALGDPIPQLNWCFAEIDPSSGLAFCSGTVNLPANLYSGAPVLTTTAVQGSPTGSYPINLAAGTLTSSVYSFVFEPGVLTITPASSYTLSVNPASVTIPSGQSRQVTITLTPVNNFVGTVALACSGAPAGVTCTTSPASLTTYANAEGAANPVSGTLTISAGEAVARDATGGQGNLLAAGILGLPGLFAGALVLFRRRRFYRHSVFTSLLLLVALAASITCVSACGGGSAHSSAVAASTTQIMITGTGTASAGNVAQSVGLSVTIQ